MNKAWIGRNQTSNLSVEDRFWEKVDVRSKDECWNWLGIITPKGYGHFRVTSKGMTRSHRFSYEIAFGKIPDGFLVLHKCDNRKCVNPSHLFLGTNDDNMKDMARKGRGRTLIRLGEDSPVHKLTLKDVMEIRELYSTGQYTYLQLSDRFNITYQHVGSVVTRKTWKHV